MSEHQPPRKRFTLAAGGRLVRYVCRLVLVFAIISQSVPAFAAANQPEQASSTSSHLATAPNDYYAANLFAPLPAGTITNTVSVDSTTVDPNTLNNTAIQTTTVNSVADLQITKTDGITAVVPGTTITYTIVVSNAGPSAVSNALVEDTLPTAIADATWSCDAATGSLCNSPSSGTGDINTTVDLAVNGVATLTVVALVDWPVTGSMTNTATITTPVDTTDPDPSNNSSTDVDKLLTGLVEGVVYVDEDGDGVYTLGTDTPLANVSLVITDTNGVTYTLVTNASGAYSQTVPAGNTTVDIDDADTDLPSGYVLTGGSTDPTTVTVPADGVGTDDTGYVQLSTIGDRIWLDLNGDSVQDANEPGLAGVVISLTLPNNLVIAATTGTNGYYTFSGLRPGAYTVTVDTTTLPASVTQTGDPDATVNDQTTVTITSNSNHTTADFGYQGSASIGDLVWLDRDGNGAEDVGEPGLENVVITLTMSTGFVVTTTTDSAGFYEFVGLIAGVYTVTVDSTLLPIGAVQTFDPEGAVNHEAVVTLTATSVNTTTDFGYQRQGDVFGHIFQDTNGDGDQDPGEPNLANITVIITDSMGFTQSVTTDGNGNYTATVPIDSLTALTDTIMVDVDETTLIGGGWTQTAGTDPESLTVTAYASTNAGNDGYQQLGVVEGRVYEDVNQNGVYDGADIALVGITVVITDSNGLTYTVVTNGSGYFSQTVPIGSTTVDVDDADIDAQAGDLMLENGFIDPATVTVPAGSTATTNFPYVEPLLIDKDAVTPAVIAGEQVTYTIVVRNLGAYTVTTVTISDTLPTGFTYAAGSLALLNANRTAALDPTAGDAIPTWGAWSIYPGGRVTITLVADVASSVAAGVYDNTAYATSDQTAQVNDDGTTAQDDNTPTGADPESDEDVTVTTQADLGVIKSDTPDPVAAGGTLTYTIVVTNYGPSDAQNVVITDTLPADVAFVAAPGCTLTGSDVVCNLGTIVNGSSKSIIIVVTVDPDLLVAAADTGPAIVQAPVEDAAVSSGEQPMTALSPALAPTFNAAVASAPLAENLVAADDDATVAQANATATSAAAQLSPQQGSSPQTIGNNSSPGAS